MKFGKKINRKKFAISWYILINNKDPNNTKKDPNFLKDPNDNLFIIIEPNFILLFPYLLF